MIWIWLFVWICSDCPNIFNGTGTAWIITGIVAVIVTINDKIEEVRK